MYNPLQTDAPACYYPHRVWGSSFTLGYIFKLIFFLHRIHILGNSDFGRDGHPYPALCSSKGVASLGFSWHIQSWFSKAVSLLQCIRIFVECLPLSMTLWMPLIISFQCKKRSIEQKEEHLSNINSKHLGLSPQTLNPKVPFYYEHFMYIYNSLIICPNYIMCQWVHGLRNSLNQLQICSHNLWMKMAHHIPRSERIYQLCHLPRD